MHKLLITLIALFAVGISGLAADAAYVTGTAQGSNIVVGGDGGTANVVDLAGDIVAHYTSVGSTTDTQYKTNQGGNPSATVVGVFGDTFDLSGSGAVTVGNGGVATYNMKVMNWGNQSDQIKLDNDTPTGGAKDSVTIKINGAVVYRGGTPDTYLPFALPTLAAGAETDVTITIEHDTNGALGSASARIVAKANNGSGGDAGGYTGNNGDTYAGLGDDAETLTITINQINVLLKVELDTIVTPASYNGPAGDTIPGATLTYIIRYDNDGNDTAANFTINIKIPANSKLDTTQESPHTGSNATVLITDDTGTSLPISDPNVRRIKWTFNMPVGPTNGDANNVVDAMAADADAGILKFKVIIK